MNKRGSSIIDIFFIMIMIFVIGLVSIASYMLLSNFNDEIQADPDISADAKQLFAERTNSWASTWDSAIMVLFFGIGLFLLISGFFLNTHPVFFIIVVLFSIVLVILAAIIANQFYEFSSDPDTVDYVDDFTWLPFLMNYYPQAILFLIVLLSLGLYSKVRGGGG